MAEIPIQHRPAKRRTSVWPWIFAALVVLAVVWGISMAHRGNTTTAAVDTSSAAGEVAPKPVDTSAGNLVLPPVVVDSFKVDTSRIDTTSTAKPPRKQ